MPERIPGRGSIAFSGGGLAPEGRQGVAMKIQLLSDLHNEFYRGRAVPAIHPTAADVVVLAGDIDVGVAGVRWADAEAGRLGKEVIYVVGNHEYYNHDIGLLDELRTVASDLHLVRLLENDEVVTGGVRFLGCTLWTDYRAAGGQPLAMLEARQHLNDHWVVKKGTRRFLPEDALALHEQSRLWLAQKLSEPFPGKTVVISHHGPHPLCQHPRFPLDLLAAAFWSDLSDLMEQVDVWCFGHTHANLDVQVGRCRLVSNQRGYPHEDMRDYRPDFVIVLD